MLMKKIIGLFPGQGSQKVGMGASLFERYPDKIASANELLGYDLKILCLQDPANRLQQTKFTQPALYVVNALSYSWFLEENDPPDVLLGHSLGEINALQAASVFDFETGLQIVCERSRLMTEMEDGAMAAVMGFSLEEVQTMLSQYFPDLDVANLNAHSQTVISGPVESIENAWDHFEEAGAGFTPLKVNRAFHSRYMQPMKNPFESFLRQLNFDPLCIPVIANLTADYYDSKPVRIVESLVRQVDHAVLWKDSIELLLEEESAEFVEFGEGKILSNLVKRIKKDQSKRVLAWP